MTNKGVEKLNFNVATNKVLLSAYFDACPR